MSLKPDFFLKSGQLILGCMYSGKTTELMRQMDRHDRVGETTITYKYKKDVRFWRRSHSGCISYSVPLKSGSAKKRWHTLTEKYYNSFQNKKKTLCTKVDRNKNDPRVMNT